MTKCKICGVDFTQGTDSIVMCRHHGGNVHLGCCMDICSWEKTPCHHAVGVFQKI
nr:hypothetical protein [Nanoarchaeota archaeon]